MMFVLTMSACSSKDFGKYADSTTAGNAGNAALGITALEEQGKVDDKILAKLAKEGNESSMVLYGIISADKKIALVKLVKAIAVEKPMTIVEGWVEFGNGGFTTLGKWALGTWGATEILGGMSTGTSMVGDGNQFIAPTGASGVDFKTFEGTYSAPGE